MQKKRIEEKGGTYVGVEKDEEVMRWKRGNCFPASWYLVIHLRNVAGVVRGGLGIVQDQVQCGKHLQASGQAITTGDTLSSAQCAATVSEGLLAAATQAPLAKTKTDPAMERTSNGVPRSVTWNVVAKMICK